jgi:plastocyanin
MGRLLTVLILLTSSFLVKAETVEVSIHKMLFVPEVINVNVGDIVRWVNKEKRQYHSVWFEALGDPEPDYFFPGEFFEKQFFQAGSYSYRCGPHPNMVGTVIVKASNEAASSSKENHAQNVVVQKKLLTSERQAELEYLLKQDCGSCHGMTLKGGLGPSLLPERLGKFNVEDLVAVILHGRPGTPMPPWKGILDSDDAHWLATYLKAGLGVEQ